LHAEARQQFVLGRELTPVEDNALQPQAEIARIGDEGVMDVAPGRRRQPGVPGIETAATQNQQQRGEPPDAPDLTAPARRGGTAARRGFARGA